MQVWDQGESEALVVQWQLVGMPSSKLHRVRQKRGYLVRQLKDQIQRDTNISWKWLSLAWHGDVLSDDASCPPCTGNFDIVLCSLILPIYARLSSEPCIPRRRKSRVANQSAVSRLAWMPGLVSHEWDDGDDDTACDACPLNTASHNNGDAEQDSYSNNDQRFAVYIEGLPNLPSRFLRLDLGTPFPTVSRLAERLAAVTGLDQSAIAAGRLQCADGGPRLEGARRYLHRLRVRPGDVLTWTSVAAAAANEPISAGESNGGSGSSAPEAAREGDGGNEAAGRRLRHCTGVSPAPPADAAAPGDAPAGPPVPTPSPSPSPSPSP
jgi:hypothetical protein